ncbi:hypothetical protein ACHGLA_28510 [Streptomyces sp. YH02]
MRLATPGAVRRVPPHPAASPHPVATPRVTQAPRLSVPQAGGSPR